MVILVKEMYQQIKGWNTYIFEDKNEDPYDTWERIRVSWLEMVNNEEKGRNIILKAMSLRPPWVYGRKLMWCGVFVLFDGFELQQILPNTHSLNVLGLEHSNRL